MLRVETLRWFFEDTESFISWRDCKESRTLIVYAGAGCCKSVMMRAAVDEELSSNTGRITCYFFFRRGNVLQESVSEALNALLHQIISQAPHLIHLVVAEYQKEGNNLSAKVEVLWRIICQCSSTYEGEIICILDALDECAKTNNSGRVGEDRAFVPRNFLVDKLQSLWDKNAAETRPTIGRLKFLVTIRSDVNVGFDKMTMSNASSDQLCQINKEWIVPRTDMVAFVKYKVERLAQTEEVQRQLKQQLLEKQGKSTSFLWLSLIIEAINTEDELQEQSAENLNKFLNGDVPDTVNGAYEALLPAKKDRQKTRGVFNIMLAARTPLTVPQINQALKFVLDENVRAGSNLALQKDAAFEATLASYCGALISIMPSGKDRVVTFFHSTAREFLLELLTDNAAASDVDGGEARQTTVQYVPKLKHTFNLTESNAVLRKSCINFLRWRGTSDVDANVFNWSRPDIYNGLMQYISGFTSNQPFMAYAAVNWINHLPFETTDVQVRKKKKKEISVLCDISSPVFRTWFLCCWVLWWPESELDDFFRQYLAGWIADHLYPEVDVVEYFDLDVWEIEESEKWWKWTISAPPDVWKDMLRVCKPPRDDRRGVQFIPIMATRPLAAF